MSHEGGMNPEFGMVDIVPDDDLNTRLKYYVRRHPTSLSNSE